MSNDVYAVTGTPGQRSAGSSAAVRAEFAAIAAAFDKLVPTGTLNIANALKPLRVNAAGNALEPDPSTYLTSSNALLKTAGAGQPMTGTIYWGSTVSEIVRGQNDGAFLSAYNSLGTIRTGYVSFTAGTHVDLAAENGADIRVFVGGTQRGSWDTSGNLNVLGAGSVVAAGGPFKVAAYNILGFQQTLATTAGAGGLLVYDQAGARKLELLWLGTTQGGVYGQSQGNAVLNFNVGATSFGLSYGDVLKHSFTQSGASFTGTVTATAFAGALTGNASTATALATGRSINGVTFDGTANVTVGVAAANITGTTLPAGITVSSLASVAPGCTDGTKQLGWKGLPAASVTTGAFGASDAGKCVYATGGVTVPNATMASEDVVVIQDVTGSGQTITASIAALHLTGGALTGNRTLKAWGRCSIVFISGTLATISGDLT